MGATIYWMTNNLCNIPDEINDIYFDGLLRDVGKIGILETILPGGYLRDNFSRS